MLRGKNRPRRRWVQVKVFLGEGWLDQHRAGRGLWRSEVRTTKSVFIGVQRVTVRGGGTRAGLRRRGGDLIEALGRLTWEKMTRNFLAWRDRVVSWEIGRPVQLRMNNIVNAGWGLGPLGFCLCAHILEYRKQIFLSVISVQWRTGGLFPIKKQRNKPFDTETRKRKQFIGVLFRTHLPMEAENLDGQDSRAG